MLDYKTVTAKEIKDFLDGKKLSKDEKREFYKATHPKVKQKIAKPIFDADGKAIMFQVQDKHGELKYKKDGSPMMRQKYEMVEKKDGEEEERFSMIEAKKWIANNYPDEIINVPVKKEDEKKDPFGGWA